MSSGTETRATLGDLSDEKRKAELIGGRIVRSESDYGEAAETETASKRADYFEAGTLVVWDVDPIAECVNVYRAGAPDQPVSFSRGQTADAEPAVPGWRMPVDGIFS